MKKPKGPQYLQLPNHQIYILTFVVSKHVFKGKVLSLKKKKKGVCVVCMCVCVEKQRFSSKLLFYK